MFGNSKKKVAMEVEGSGATKDMLRAKVRELFKLENFLIQAWDKGFEEWIDIEEGDVIDNNSKVLVTEIVPCVVMDLDASTASSIASSVQSLISTEDEDDLVGPSKSSEAEDRPPLTAAVDPLCTPGSSKQPMKSSSMATPNWHIKYKLPTLPAALDAKLQLGQPLKEAERSAFLEAIYNSVKVYTYYPKTGQYDTIIQLILDKYPKLINQQNMSCANVMSLWKYRLQYKFANSRKREDKSIPSVKLRKRKGAQLPSQPKAKRAAPQWGMTNYLPHRNESEDDASISIHIKWMQQELPKKKPNYQRVTEAMVATFADRRKLVIKEAASVARMKETYPWLFEEDELLQEFQRIEGQSSMTSLLDEGLEKYAERIVTCARSMKKKSKLFEDALATIALEKEESARKESSRRAAVLAVPGLLNEKVENMLVCEDQMDTSNIPVFIKAHKDKEEKDEYSVIVDSMNIVTTTSFLTAFANYLGAYYCFNLAYPLSLRKTLHFFQRVILNIQDNLPIDKSVVRILDKINQVFSKSD